MDFDIFFRKIRTYGSLSSEAENDWADLLKTNTYPRGSDFLRTGEMPKKAAFVLKGLFSQYYTTDSGDTVINYFFPEGRIAGSIPATLTRTARIIEQEPYEIAFRSDSARNRYKASYRNNFSNFFCVSGFARRSSDFLK